VSYTEDVPLIRHDVTGWEPITDQATARAVPIEKPRRRTATTVVIGEARAPRPLRPASRRLSGAADDWDRIDAHDLPTPRSISRTAYRVRVWCKSCRHAKDADLAALIATGRGDVPLVQMKWRCGNCG
jgi:hypothetical protein